MKQIASSYTYNKTTGQVSLLGVSIDRDQLLLIVNTTRNVTYYNFADSATTLQTFLTQGGSTSVTLNSSIITASSAHANGDALTIYYEDQENPGLNELKMLASTNYIKVNINVGNSAANTLVSNVYLRKIGEYSYESIRYQGGEDEAYLRVYLDNGDGSTQRVWRLSSSGAYANITGLVAYRYPQNAGSNNGDALPPKTGWALETGITGTISISYEQPAPVTLGAGTAQIGSVAVSGVSGTVTAGNSEWVLLGTRDWNDDQSIWQIGGLNAYSSIRLDNYGGGASTIEAMVYPPSGGDAFWRWDGQTENDTNKVLGFGTYNSHTSQVQNDQISFSIIDNDTNDPNFSKIYGKKDFTNLGLTNQQLRASPVPVSIPANVATYVGRDSFTSTTAATIASAVGNRKALTIFSEGPGLLYVCAGSTCTTTSYQVRLSAGEYWECPTGQLALIHTAIFGSTGTARVVSVN